jgi:hypothetical protein
MPNLAWRSGKLNEIFKFLKKNKKWNEQFQRDEYIRCLGGCLTQHDLLINFLYMNVNSQSSPKMDLLEKFWQSLHSANKKEISTLVGFIKFLEELPDDHRKKNFRLKDDDNWENLYQLLSSLRGWGDKTAALFVKATIKLHNDSNFSKKYHFWSDAYKEKSPLVSKPYLPFDKVIKEIFLELGHPGPEFKNINDELRANYSHEDMLIWDDLWFWGFFTQNSSRKKRVLGWNSGKFWGQICAPKNAEDELKELANEFLALLK